MDKVIFIENQHSRKNGNNSKILNQSILPLINPDTVFSEIKNDTKPVKNRVITQNKNWILDVSLETQIDVIKSMYDKITRLSACNEESNEIKEESITLYSSASFEKMLNSQINQKIMSYKYQDIQNKKYNPELFITFNQVIELLHASNLTCYYCQHIVKLLYDVVRDPRQWTLERMDNKLGHNCNNVVISCLTCNLRRRTMYHERYLFTKQIGKQSIIKLS
jgi:hypothetical protein